MNIAYHFSLWFLLLFAFTIFAVVTPLTLLTVLFTNCIPMAAHTPRKYTTHQKTTSQPQTRNQKYFNCCFQTWMKIPVNTFLWKHSLLGNLRTSSAQSPNKTSNEGKIDGIIFFSQNHCFVKTISCNFSLKSGRLGSNIQLWSNHLPQDRQCWKTTKKIKKFSNFPPRSTHLQKACVYRLYDEGLRAKFEIVSIVNFRTCILADKVLLELAHTSWHTYTTWRHQLRHKNNLLRTMTSHTFVGSHFNLFY